MRLAAGLALVLAVATPSEGTAHGGLRFFGSAGVERDEPRTGRRSLPDSRIGVAVAVGQIVSVPLRETNSSGVGGWAILTADGARTIVAVSVEGAESGLPAHIHAGRCDALDPAPVFPLTDVYPDRPTTTSIDATLDELLAGAYAVDVHRPAPNWAALQDPDNVVACADISGGAPAPVGGASGAGTAARATKPSLLASTRRQSRGWTVGLRRGPARVRRERRRR